MNMRLRLLTFVVASCLPLVGHAHRAWLLPSATVSTVNQWVTVDAAASDGLFNFDHRPLRLDALTITAPNGSNLAPQNASTGTYRSTFDVHLEQSGTYKLAILNRALFATYQENGATKRWRGTPEKFAAEVPANAKGLEVSENFGRVETFVTAGKPSLDALKPSGQGLELVPVTHPNDLYAGEAATFRFMLDGKPATNLPVTIVAGGTRYRDQQDELKLTSDEQGQISVTWPAPGMYWLEATLQDQKPSMPQAKQRRASYAATLEILPP